MPDPVTLAALSIVLHRAARRVLATCRRPAIAPRAPRRRPPARGRHFDFPLFTPYRGAFRTTQDEVERQLTAEAGPLYLLAGTMWPARRFLNKLTFITGRPDTGKTVLVRMMMESAAGLFHVLPAQCELGLYPGDGKMRWLVVDPTNAYLPLLYQVVPGDVPIVRATPVDRDGKRWDIAADITSDALNGALQTGLFPDSLTQKASDPFWYTKARQLTAAIVTVYLDRNANWQFHDLIIPVKYPQFLRPVLKQSARTVGMVKQDLVGRLGRDIVTTTSSVLDKMAIAAALWQRAKATFSLREFLDSRQVLHFAYTPDMIPCFAGIAGALTHVMVLLGIARNDPFNHTLLWLDEGRYLSALTALEDLAARGRGAGFGQVVATQGTPGLINKWGEAPVRELLDLVATWVTLSAGPETAEAFCRAVGKIEGLQESHGYSFTNGYSEAHARASGGSTSYSIRGGRTSGSNWGETYTRTTTSSRTTSANFALVTKDAILPSEVTNLRYANAEEDRLFGFAFNPEVGAFEFEAPFLAHFRGLPDPLVDAMPLRPECDQRLMPWTEEDITRIGLEPTPELIAAVKSTRNHLGGKP